MSIFRQKAGRKDPGDTDVVDYLCWQAGSLIMMVVVGVLAIHMIAVSLWLAIQWGPNPIVFAVVPVVGVCLLVSLAFLAWSWSTGRALMGILEGRGSGILFMVLPALSATPLIVLWLLSRWQEMDVAVGAPFVIYYTTLAVLLLTLPPTGIRWRRKEKTS